MQYFYGPCLAQQQYLSKMIVVENGTSNLINVDITSFTSTMDRKWQDVQLIAPGEEGLFKILTGEDVRLWFLRINGGIGKELNPFKSNAYRVESVFKLVQR